MHNLYNENYKTPVKETQDTQRKGREKDTSSQRKISHIHGLEAHCSNDYTSQSNMQSVHNPSPNTNRIYFFTEIENKTRKCLHNSQSIHKSRSNCKQKEHTWKHHTL